MKTPLQEFYEALLFHNIIEKSDALDGILNTFKKTEKTIIRTAWIDGSQNQLSRLMGKAYIQNSEQYFNESFQK